MRETAPDPDPDLDLRRRSLNDSLPDLSSPPETAIPQVPTSLFPKTCCDMRPVGGCLRNYVLAWEEISHDDWVLDVLRNGYAPQFKDHPPRMTKNWKVFESVTRSTRPERALALTNHIQELLSKEAIEKVRDPTSLGFYSNVFMVPKKNGKFRLVINLKELNNYIIIPGFRMETVASVTAAVQPGDWAISLDLTDAYHHVPIALWFRKFLRFVVNGQVYQYNCLPFGLSTAPLVFTKMLDPLSVHLHSLGILFHRYLDDLLIRSQSREQCLKWAQYTLDLLFKLGLGVNLAKSDLDPSMIFIYIGVCFLTALGVTVPPDDRISKIQESIRSLIRAGTAPASTWLSLIGLLGSAEKQVPFGRLHIRPIHFCVRRQFCLGVHALSRPVTLDREALDGLNWSLHTDNLRAGQPLVQFAPDVTLFTDSSLTHWGAHAPGFQASGAWSVEERNLSINCLELLAVTRALQSHPDFWRGKKVLVATDNTTAVAYINHQGGTRSMNLMDLSYQLFGVVLQLKISIKARHVPGKLNRLADLLSRQNQIVNTEWTLCPGLVQRLWDLWGRSHLDLMATQLNNQLPVYISPVPDPQAFGIDAMSLSWRGMDAYVFPPWDMIQEVLIKLQSETCILTAILPRWPNRSWFPLLLECLVDFPRRLPIQRDLISMPHNGLCHGAIHSLDLHACRLSSTRQLVRAFREKCQNEHPQPVSGILLTESTTPGGRGSLFGVINGVMIPSKPL